MSKDNGKYFKYERYTFGGWGGVFKAGKWFKLAAVLMAHDKVSPIKEHFVLQLTRTEENLFTAWCGLRLLGWDVWHLSLQLNLNNE